MAGSGPSLFVTYSGVSGGASRFLVEIAGGIGRPAVVACPPGPVADTARERGLQVLELPERPLELRDGPVRAARHLAGHARDIQRLVRSLDPELVFAWGMRSAIASRRVRPPLFIRHHDFIPGPWIGRALRATARRAERVVVNSDAVRNDLGLDAEVIWPGVDLELFSPPASPPPGPPVAIWLGALVPWKRPDLAVEIAAKLPGLRLRLAGAPIGEEPPLRTGENVELLGQVADPVEELRGAHLLLHTADREPFGIAVAEALACGTPVVAPAAGGPAELIDETCGRLYPPGDATAAAAAINEVLENRDQLAKGARKRAEDQLDIEHAREKFRALLPSNEERGTRSDLSVVAVSHNSKSELEALLKSAAQHLPEAELIIVDCASSDGSADAARTAGAQVIELDNVGYGPAANSGVAAASRPVTAVMNADVELVDSSLAALAAELQRPGAPERLLAPALVLPDGSRQDSAQHEPASAPLALFALVPRSAEPWRSRGPRPVGWAVGACIAGRTETLRRLGPFDPDVFLYAEDLDLGLRAADAGVETWFWPEARVLHQRAHATKPAFGGEAYELLARRRREVVRARRGAGRLRVDDALQALTFANRLAIKTLVRHDATRERSQLRALRSARRDG